jgi:hypothetical protein
MTEQELEKEVGLSREQIDELAAIVYGAWSVPYREISSGRQANCRRKARAVLSRLKELGKLKD